MISWTFAIVLILVAALIAVAAGAYGAALWIARKQRQFVKEITAGTDDSPEDLTADEYRKRVQEELSSMGYCQPDFDADWTVIGDDKDRLKREECADYEVRACLNRLVEVWEISTLSTEDLVRFLNKGGDDG